MTTSGTSLNKVPHLWFEDGNIIINCGNKAFRVYKGVLASRSPVFRDMFNTPPSSTFMGAGGISDSVETDSKPLPSAPPAPWAQDGADRIATDGEQQAHSAPWAQDGADMITTDGVQEAYSSLGATGCPVVRLTDKPQEVEWLLSAFFHSHIGQYSGNTSALAGILRLATKYEVNSLRRWSLECLERLYPFATDVDGDDLMRVLKVLPDGFEWVNGMFPLIEVAMTVGVPWVLPQVLWQLQSVRLTVILHHPEWAEFPDERRTQFLRGYNHRYEEEIDAFKRVLGLYRAGAVHGKTPLGSECEETFQEAFRYLVGEKGSDATRAAFWGVYTDQLGCAECKQRYTATFQADFIDLFLTLQHRNGLPAPAEMKELREKFYQQGFMHDQ